MSDRTALWAAGDRMTLVLTGADTGGSCFVMEQVVPRHVRPPGRHAHARESHVWYVQDGHGRFYLGDTEMEAGPGAILFGPPGVPHAFSADSPELRVLVVTMPAGLEEFFLATGEPARGDGPPPADWRAPADDVEAIAATFEIDLLGPEPRWHPIDD
jgi:mannose-6-phosphate isomerase-like protein (cupin superfamily)